MITISLFPMIVPPHFTLWQAASSDRTQAYLLVGTLVLLPAILMYTIWSYWVFRGKVRADIGYRGGASKTAITKKSCVFHIKGSAE
ncbi:cytochrome d ubiquinol oxidase subunit II [Bradyrhizobium sp.]|uniref:cytochrome d ubiquinol oxidase subunit II n=1 Tax=Bradyrhizobium sp. TaxID=376 RepID=UPI003C703CFF